MRRRTGRVQWRGLLSGRRAITVARRALLDRRRTGTATPRIVSMATAR